jgi:signal transduction histidine kinase
LLVKNDDLQKSDATKNKLFSIIAHDLKNPLHAILSFAEIFHNNHDLFNAEELKEFSKDIYNASKNTCNIAENLLSWSRSQLKCITINAVKLDLDKFISDTVSNLKNTADNKDVEIKVYKIKEILAYADIDIAKVVLQNLLTNAIKFSHRKSTISINAKLKQIDNNEYVEICVADSGLGINVDYLKKLFKSKDLKSIAGTENEQGTGIGLMLCKDFAERNGGKIWVESEFGKGSKFYFTLPKLKSSVSYTPLSSAKVACSV